MTFKNRKIIGLLTFVLLIPSLITFYRLANAGVWFTIAPLEQVFHLYAYLYYYSIILPIIALVIGMLTLRGGQWTSRANVVFQIVSIIIIVTDSIVISIAFPAFDLLFGEYPKIISLALSAAILYLLFRKKDVPSEGK